MGIGLGLQGVAIGCDLNVDVNVLWHTGYSYRLWLQVIFGEETGCPLPCITAAAAASADTGLRIFLQESGEGRGIPLK